MPERFKNSINLPIAIPAWGLVTILAGAVFTAGTMVTKMDTLIETVRDGKEQLASVKEKQIGGLAAIGNLQQQQQNHETRLTNVERIILEGKRQ